MLFVVGGEPAHVHKAMLQGHVRYRGRVTLMRCQLQCLVRMR